MSLIEEYYELNEAEEVSGVWKVLQIGFYICAACLGLWCGYTLAILRLRFDDRCYLFSEVAELHSKEDAGEQNNVNWESDTWCDYYQYSMVSSFIVAIIWATFFLMCGKGGKSLTGFVFKPVFIRLPQPWRIVWSSLIFNFIYFIIALSTAIKIQQGTDHFCGRKNYTQKKSKQFFMENCEPLKLLLKKNVYLTSVQLEIVVQTSWGCAVSWIILFVLSFLRIIFVVDFHMYKICVFKIDDTIQNKKEVVLRITNYEEPKQLYGKWDGRQIYSSASLEAIQDLEAGNRKKTKVDKKSMRQHFNAASRSPLQNNAAFYVMADIRMLHRDKKRKRSSKVLDEALAKSNTYFEPELPISMEIQSNADVLNLYNYPKEFHDEENGGSQIHSFSSLHTANEDWDERSETDSDSTIENEKANALLKSKKRL